MVKRNRAALLPTNLPQLQNLIKRDPPSYREEFMQQWRHYESSLAIFQLKPDAEAKEFQDLVTFLAHVAPCYPKESEAFPLQIMTLLREHPLILSPDVRKALVQCLVLLRNKHVVDSLT
jgi:protein SDA1